MKNKNNKRVFMAICTAAATYRFLTAATLICVAASVAASLISPLLLARVIDRLTKGVPLTLTAALLYFGSLALEGMLSSAQEALLVLFGQKMTHALRSEMSQKLIRLRTDALVSQKPGEVAAVSGQVPETLHNIRTIRALGAEDYMERRYDRSIGESYAAVEKTNFYDAIYSPIVLLLNAAVVGTVMLLSASGNASVLALFGMSVGTSVAVINYISRIFSPIESLGMEIQTIQSAMAGVKRINAFLSEEERPLPSDNRAVTHGGDVVLSHITFGYGEKPVLRDFFLTVKNGEQVTLAGRTGAGKSTVFRLLLGLYRPDKGKITVCGADISDITDRERRFCIGCVEQHFSRVPGTVLEQITLGDRRITAEMAENAARLAGIDGAIAKLPDGYNTVCTEGMFSQGEWQLLSIARAAAANLAVLLLDEITANLDAATEARVLAALHRAAEGHTVISISHRVYKNSGGRTVEIKAEEA